MAIPTSDLDRRFGYHPPTTDLVREAHERARAVCRQAADDLLDLIPESAGREAALVVTHLEDAMMWANAGIARHGNV
jgi:hypothetical protein